MLLHSFRYVIDCCLEFLCNLTSFLFLFSCLNPALLLREREREAGRYYRIDMEKADTCTCTYMYIHVDSSYYYMYMYIITYYYYMYMYIITYYYYMYMYIITYYYYMYMYIITYYYYMYMYIITYYYYMYMYISIIYYYYMYMYISLTITSLFRFCSSLHRLSSLFLAAVALLHSVCMISRCCIT